MLQFNSISIYYFSEQFLQLLLTSWWHQGDFKLMCEVGSPQAYTGVLAE